MCNDLFSLSGKRALVTGGANGIGFAVASAFCRYGASVIIADYSESALRDAGRKLSKEGFCVDTVFCDVSSVESVNAMVECVKNKGGLDIFVNSAAVTNRKTVKEMSIAEWQKIINTNLNGAFYLAKAVSELMIEQKSKGKMIFIVSTGAYRASAKFGAYSASKAGVVMLMKTLALELAGYGICCNAIAPTATDTNFTKDYYEANPEVKNAVIKNHPLGRIAVPEDYQGAAVFLASKASDFVTGELLVVDGGKTAK
jgi:Dehydrogenases with different specificities (related to short-chain alcohol dehydrogenases)